MMITACRRFAVSAATLLLIAPIGCDAGRPSRTADEFAADSALAADLALANRDTLLVDSIGAYRPSRDRDTATVDAGLPATAGFEDVTASGSAARVPPSAATAAAPVTRAPVPASRPAAPAAPAAAPAPATKTAPAARLTGARACSSPTTQNQNECLRALLPAADARMNRIYRALITEMRRQEGVKGNARDPVSVQRLRVAQRAWLVDRDRECRRRGRRTEGARWARPRVSCLGQLANRRANELADDFSRLTVR